MSDFTDKLKEKAKEAKDNILMHKFQAQKKQ
jgi:hypothetical protein